MRFLVLDDLCAPTGYANRVLKTADPSLCNQFMNLHLVDAVGPTPHVTIDVESFLLPWRVITPAICYPIRNTSNIRWRLR